MTKIVNPLNVCLHQAMQSFENTRYFNATASGTSFALKILLASKRPFTPAEY
jgi:hypothetical protein